MSYPDPAYLATGGSPLHFHRTISESFFVLSGTVTLEDGEREVKARSGDYLYVPPGGLHGFQNNTEETASMHDNIYVPTES